MKKILILCTGNSCRSQMAEGWFNFFEPSYDVYSAGTHPDPLNEKAVFVMNESGVDISKNISNHVSEYVDYKFDYVITVCDNAEEKCPYFTFTAKRLHNSFVDPAKAKGNRTEQLLVYRTVRDEIRQYVKGLIDSL